MKATIAISNGNIISKVDDRIYGSFIEHLGRAVYNGIYEPGHLTADDEGFRKDVLELVKELNVPIVRYPGGNFVSGYNWEDGTGDKSKRPRKMELAWQAIETNQVGIDEFQSWAKKAGSEVMMAVNLGTRGADDARNLVEYCNSKADTYYADMRRKNGFENPFGIKLWCLGNEMDGPWQICAQTAYEYARKACETAKVMKWVDSSIELVACGSCNPYMSTFGAWEETVLRETYEHIDYLSVHSYYGNPDNDTPTYFAQPIKMDKFIKDIVAVCDKVKLEKKSDKSINISFDEYNVWFHSNEQDKQLKKWTVAPHQLEDIYTFEDAIVVGGLIMTLINNSDRVKIACLAQLVNVIAPIMTVNGGGVWKQTIFYPYLHCSKYGRGTALKCDVQSDCYDCNDIKNVPYVDTACVYNDVSGELTVFAVNRSLTDTAEADINISGFENAQLIEHIEYACDDLKAVNSADTPDNVVPVSIKPCEKVVFKAQSWNVLRYRVK